jgi:hypothetical protein
VPTTRHLLVLAMLTAAFVGCDALRAARGCGVVPLDPAVVDTTPAASGSPVSAEERELRARETMADRFGLSVDEVVTHEKHAYPGGTVHGYKLYGVDGRYFGLVFIDASGAPVSEASLMLSRTIADVRASGKVDSQLSDAVARALPGDVVPVMFQLVAPPWDGPPTPWPRDLPGDAWNAFVERHADTFYRPRVTRFIEHLRSIGARDIAPDLAPGAYVKDGSVFARVPQDQVCSVVRRSDVLRAGHNPPIYLN